MTPEEAMKILDDRGMDTSKIIATLQSEGYDTSAIEPKKSLGQKVKETLNLPRQKAKEGLNTLSNMVPQSVGGDMTGNLPMDILKGTPRVVTETLAETAPEFVSPLSIVLGGASQGLRATKPLGKMLARGYGRQAEQFTGAAPGSLEAAFKDPTLIFAKGKKAVQGIYESGKEVAGQVGKKLANTANKLDFVRKALKMAKENKLNETEALEARKELGRLKNQVTGEFYRKAHDTFDEIAKKVYAGADTAHRRAIQAESLRNIAPQNKYGGASAFKMGIMTALEGLGESGPLAKFVARSAQLALSPLAQGSAATAAGMGTRQILSPLINSGTNPVALAAVFENLNRNRKKQKGG